MAITPRPFPPPTPFSAPINAGSADNNVPAVAGTSGQLLGQLFQPGSGIGIYGLSGGPGAGVYGNSGTGAGVYGTSTDFDGVHGESQTNQHAGVSGINNSGTAAGNGGPGVYGSSSNLDGVQGWSQSKDNAGVSARNTAGGYGLWAQAKTAGYFDGDVHVTGTHTVDGDIVLTKGADCAEQFDVSPQVVVQPGTVMVITASGDLEPSHLPYDKRVAGVISGAGDLRPAIILDKQQSDRNRASVALVGKVYCKVDANDASVEVGDLLTTSPTLGHAMKAGDPGKAFGAVIGKALRPLRSGQGLIPILIALQ